MSREDDSKQNVTTIEDVFGLKHVATTAKYASKLLETVRGAIGDFTEPSRIRKRADAEAYATVRMASARVEARELEYRQLVRFEHLGNRRQRNIESVIVQAAQLPTSDIDAQPVDDDWAVAFFTACEDVGNEQMQSLWAKLLAGEVAHPGTYSLRTLQLVKTLSQTDARLFTDFCSYCWKFRAFTPAVYVAFSWPVLKYEYDEFRMGQLRTIGLVGDEVAIPLNENPEPAFEYFGKRYQLRLTVRRTLRTALFIPLTEAGIQLFPISGAEGDRELARRVKALVWSQWRAILCSLDPEPDDVGGKAEHVAESLGYRPMECLQCSGAGGLPRHDGRGRQIQGTDPCSPCEETGRLWLPSGVDVPAHQAGTRKTIPVEAVTDSQLLAK